MSGKDLFEGMSYVDERFVDEAENKTLPKQIVSPWIKVASMVACLCLIIFSLYSLSPYLYPGSTEGAGQAAPDENPVYGWVDTKDQVIQDSNVVSPGEMPTGEVPSVILYVEEMTDIGFVGTVAELVDTDIFKIGMELNVVIANETRHESTDGTPAMSAESTIDYSGCYVIVQFTHYNQETDTIVVNMIQEAQPSETKP